uniref:COP9 signalosome complex subunit 3 n=1 Tax=Bursaphelenchus xylophilus TaxID=6326 RepID=A0A1I7S3L7_BURXY
MVNALQSFMAAANQYGSHPLKEVVEALKKATPTLNKVSYADIDKFVDVLIGKNNGVGACFLLHGKIKRGSEAVADYLQLLTQSKKVIDLINDSEIEYVYEKFSQTFTDLALLYVDNKIPLHGIKILKFAIQKLTRGVNGTITNLHPALLGLCLAANRFDPALEYLNLDAEAIFLNAINGPVLDSQSILLFFYYGGMIYIALEMWEEASFYLQTCVCLPAVSASAIMVEALKKLILVNCILDKNEALPSYRSAALQRASQFKCTTYHAVAASYNEICTKKDLSKIKRKFSLIFNKDGDQLRTDKNTGLVRKVQDHSIFVRTNQLSQVFTRLKLSDVRAYLEFKDEVADPEILVQSLIQKSLINGQIDQRTESVIFAESAKVDIDANQLESAMKNCVELSEVLYKCHQEMNLHPIYLQKSGKKGGASGSNQFAGNMMMEDEGVVAPSVSS